MYDGSRSVPVSTVYPQRPNVHVRCRSRAVARDPRPAPKACGAGGLDVDHRAVHGHDVGDATHRNPGDRAGDGKLDRDGLDPRQSFGAADLEADERGRITVDSGYRTKVPGIYAAGDIIGFPSLASVCVGPGALLHTRRSADVPAEVEAWSD